MPTKEEQKVDTEQRILEAALKVFALKGKDGARMQEIADAAGINKAMLHYYFRSKERLYLAVFRYVFQRFALQHANSVRDAGTFAQTLKLFIDVFIDKIRSEPDVMRLMVNENLSGGTTMGQIIAVKDEFQSPPSILLEKINEAVASGEIRPVDPEHTLLTILSSCLFFFIWEPTVKIRIPKSKNWDAFIEQRKQHIFDLVYHGMVQHPPAS